MLLSRANSEEVYQTDFWASQTVVLAAFVIKWLHTFECQESLSMFAFKLLRNVMAIVVEGRGLHLSQNQTNKFNMQRSHSQIEVKKNIEIIQLSYDEILEWPAP